MERKTIVIAEEGRQDITITRQFDLPVALLFKAYQEPELLEQWMGTRVLKMDCRKHGSYVFETVQNDKVVFRANGAIHEWIPNKEIIRTFEMEGAEIGAQLEFLTFESLSPSESKLTIHTIFRSEAHRALQLQMPFAYGLNMAHDRLQEILSPLKNN
jgi:uncharacterized protein YndB with AHSA1/START domain